MLSQERDVFKEELTIYDGEFPGGSVGRTWSFHCRGLGSIPGQGTKILHASQCGPKPTTTTTTQQYMVEIKVGEL